jgi:hypothetical protein
VCSESLVDLCVVGRRKTVSERVDGSGRDSGTRIAYSVRSIETSLDDIGGLFWALVCRKRLKRVEAR